MAGGTSLGPGRWRVTSFTFQHFRSQSISGTCMHERQCTDLVDHVTFGMPALATHCPIDLYELLQNSRIAAWAFGGKTC